MLLLTGFYLEFFVWGRKSILKKLLELAAERKDIGLFGGPGGMHGAIHVRKIYCMERPIARFSPTANVEPQQRLVA